MRVHFWPLIFFSFFIIGELASTRFLPQSPKPLGTKKVLESSKEIWFNQIKKQISESEYHFNLSEQNDFLFQAVNRKRNLRFFLNYDQLKISDRSANPAWIVKIKPLGLGRDKIIESFKLSSHSVQKTNLKLIGDMNEIHFSNTPNGLRQDFLIRRKPQGVGALKLKFKLETNLEVKNTFRSLYFKNKKGIEVLQYRDLLVKDNLGKILPAKFKLEGKIASIEVDDRSAKYPILIDPLATTPNWSFENNQADAYLGYSMAYVGDVNKDGYGDILIGAPNYDNGEVDEGIAYLFYGSATGLSATPAWSYECNIVNCQLGYSVSGAGDVNYDTYKDFIIGAPFYTNGQTSEGAVFVFHGTAATPSTTPNRTLESNIVNARFGYSVSGGGRFNNDNYSDIVIGAPLIDNPMLDEGRVYLYRGSSKGVAATSTNTLEINQAEAHFGEAVKIIPDMDGNGYSEIAVGAPLYDNDESNEGAVFIYKASSTGLSTTVAWIGEGNRIDAYYGSSIASGDVNADNKSDLVVGAPHWSGPSDSPMAAGAAYLYYGTSTLYNTIPDASFFGTSDWDYFGGGVAIGDLNTDRFAEVAIGSVLYTNSSGNEGKVEIYSVTSYRVNSTPIWTKIGNISEAYLGHSIAIGDINGDGCGDLMIAAVYESNGQSYEGKAYSYLGGPSGMSLTAQSSFNYDSQASSSFAATMSSAGDVNNDGYDDVLVGAYNFDNGQTNEGKVYLFKGTSAGLSSSADWNWESNQASANAGYALNKAGDVNNDGYADVIVGAYLFDNGQTNEGRAYVFHGSSTTLSASPNWTTESNQAQARYGMSVSYAGDVNGDGYSDILVGAPYFDTTATDAGKVYLYLGSSTGLSTTPAWSGLGAQATAYYGWSISGAGDTNNDGFSDLIIGEPKYDNVETDEGKIYVYLGSNGTISTTPVFEFESNKASAQLGFSVSNAGKLNSDNYDDVVAGAPYYTNTLTSEGGMFVFYGSSSGITSSNYFSKFIAQTSANFGKLVKGLGDIDGDGYAEVAALSPLYDNGQTNEGAVFIYLGTPDGINQNFSWRGEGDVASIQYGTSLAGDLDINNDGLNDLVVGAPLATVTNTSDGKIFVYRGIQK